MREDDALLERLQLYKADNAVEYIMPAVGIKFLLIDENALLVIARKDAGSEPLVQKRTGLGIAVVAALRQLEPD